MTDERDKIPAAIVEGPHGVRPEEYQATIDLINLVFRDREGMSPTMAEEYPLLLTPENRDYLRIVLEDGQPVAHVGVCVRPALLAGCGVTIGSIGSVCAHPAVRERGYASLALRDAVTLLEARHVDLMLVSGDRGLYRRAGCVDARPYAYILSASPAIASPEGMRISRAGAERLDDLIRVHQREATRFVRPRDDWEKSIRVSPKNLDASQERQFLLADDETGNALAYIVADLISPRESAGRYAFVTESAGDAAAVKALVTELTAWPELEAAHVMVPAHDVALSAMLREVVTEAPALTPIEGTVRLIDPVSFVQHIGPYLAERLGTETAASLSVSGEGDHWTVRLGEAAMDVPDIAALTLLLLGDHDRDQLACLQAAPAELRIALDAAFPVPLPLPGLNYV